MGELLLEWGSGSSPLYAGSKTTSLGSLSRARVKGVTEVLFPINSTVLSCTLETTTEVTQVQHEQTDRSTVYVEWCTRYSPLKKGTSFTLLVQCFTRLLRGSPCRTEPLSSSSWAHTSPTEPCRTPSWSCRKHRSTLRHGTRAAVTFTPVIESPPIPDGQSWLRLSPHFVPGAVLLPARPSKSSICQTTDNRNRHTHCRRSAHASHRRAPHGPSRRIPKSQRGRSWFPAQVSLRSFPGS
jgi:hypothetical protein